MTSIAEFECVVVLNPRLIAQRLFDRLSARLWWASTTADNLAPSPDGGAPRGKGLFPFKFVLFPSIL